MLDTIQDQYNKIMDNVIKSTILIDMSLVLGISMILITVFKHFIK